MKLQGKTALVTGGARGIGAALAAGFAREGAYVCFANIELDVATATVAGIGGAYFAQHHDVTKRGSIDACIKDVAGKAGGVDILVNNAAISDMAPLQDVTEQSFDRQFAVNVKETLFTAHAAADAMVARGKGGKIINFASQVGRRGEALALVYCATKAAVISMTQSTGLGLIKHGINVNGIAPGVVDTPMWNVVDAHFARYENRPIGEKKTLVGEAVPFGRMDKPEALVGCAVCLASSDSDYVVAQTFNVDGGQWMS